MSMSRSLQLDERKAQQLMTLHISAPTGSDKKSMQMLPFTIFCNAAIHHLLQSSHSPSFAIQPTQVGVVTFEFLPCLSAFTCLLPHSVPVPTFQLPLTIDSQFCLNCITVPPVIGEFKFDGRLQSEINSFNFFLPHSFNSLSSSPSKSSRITGS